MCITFDLHSIKIFGQKPHGHPVTEQRVTAQWSYIVSDPDFFATIIGLAAHYFHLL